MTTTPIADAIRAIEDRIGDERYWTKFAMRDGDGRSCVMGAAVQIPRPKPARLFEFLHYVACEFTSNEDGFGWDAMGFNDEADTTHADVMLLLATALDVAEAEGL